MKNGYFGSSQFLFTIAYLDSYDIAVLPIYFPEIAATKRGKFSGNFNWFLQLSKPAKCNALLLTVIFCTFLVRFFFHITVLLGTITLPDTYIGKECLYLLSLTLYC